MARGIFRASVIIFRYAKSDEYIFNQPFVDYDGSYLESKYRHRDGSGRLYRLDNLTGPGGAAKGNAYYELMGVTRYWRYSKERMAALVDEGRIIQTKPGGVPQYKRFLDEMPGAPVSDDWDDIRPINSQAQERLGYPTQKPLALPARILIASSNEGNLVLDPFCGCGTTIHAAQKRDRHWIGIDVTHLAIALVERRLREAFPGIVYEVHGVPKDVAGARDLAVRDKHEFQKWITATIGAQPYKGGKKGMDRGIDGYLHFRDADKKPQFAIVSVNGGENINSGMVRDLKGTMEREKASLGYS